MKKPLSLLLSIILILSLATPALAGTVSGDQVRRAVVRFDAADTAEAMDALAATPGVTVLWTYSRLFSGAAVEAPADLLAGLQNAAGVEAAALSRTYARPQSGSGEPLAVSNSLDLMGAEDLLDRGLDGDGLVVAVLDSGLRLTHAAFRDYGLSEHPALSREDVDAFTQEGGTPGKYLSARIPFAYDYAHGDDSVWTRDEHGTHVSALAVGYAENGDGDVLFRGAAPAAQLLSMKVFPDNADAGADDATVLKALEDAYALGADIINLSLGTPSGFTGHDSLDGLYAEVFQKLAAEGIVLCAAAGNTGAATSFRVQGGTLPTGGYTDYGTVNAPATYPVATAVAAADAMSYVAQGCLRAGERSIPFLDGAAQEGEDPPRLLTLAGKTFELVPIPGVGRTEDFAGLKLRGKIALVERGEIPFTEKAENAERAGAAACLIYNSDRGTVQAVVENVSIPCATLSRADGLYLLEQERVTVSGQPLLVTGGEQPSMLDASAWGTTGDLRFLPAFTAPGGSILSASAAGDYAYALQSGTSMAAPNAAGAFAVLLQALRERGIEDRAERARLAEDLLASTARLMADERGTPLSPRRQGAGLLDLSAAVNSPLVVERPLLELGDNARGRFTLSFTVRNLSDAEQILSVEPTVLTDDWAAGADGVVRSLLAPKDITDSVKVTGPEELSIPAGGSKKITLTLTVDAALKKELKEIFPNGFFTEGYITLENRAGQAVHASFLGYCGHWAAAPILEPTDFRDAVDAKAEGRELTVDMGANLVFVSDNVTYTEGRPLLGQNPYGDFTHSDGRNALAGPASDALYTGGRLMALDLYTLRNAARVVMVVQDARTGQIYRVDDAPWVPKSGLDDITYTAAPAGTFFWDGTGSDGAPLPGGTRVNVSFYAWLESDAAMAAAYRRAEPDPMDPASYRWLTGYDRALAWRFPVTVDRAAPTAEADLAGDTLTITLSDSQYLAHAAVYDGDGNLLAEESYADEKAGQKHDLTLDLTGYGGLETVYVTAADYAANQSGFSIDLIALAAGEEIDPPLCAAALLTDVDRGAWYHDAVDYAYAAGLMGEGLTFRPGENATRIQVISALYRLAGRPETGGARVPFTDVPGNADFKDDLRWAYENGLATGYSDTFFGPYANIPRQQLAALLLRYAALEAELPAPHGAALDAFSDRAAVSPWAEDALAWAVEAGILSGRPDGTLDPRGYVTRAELAEILLNFRHMT